MFLQWGLPLKKSHFFQFNNIENNECEMIQYVHETTAVADKVKRVGAK